MSRMRFWCAAPAQRVATSANCYALGVLKFNILFVNSIDDDDDGDDDNGGGGGGGFLRYDTLHTHTNACCLFQVQFVVRVG